MVEPISYLCCLIRWTLVSLATFSDCLVFEHMTWCYGQEQECVSVTFRYTAHEVANFQESHSLNTVVKAVTDYE